MKRYTNYKEWRILKLEEALRFTDLMKNSSMSSFTRKFAKETNKLMGNAPNRAKLVHAKVNTKKDYVTFIWLTERTPKYPDNFNTQVVDPSNMKLKKGNLYEVEIRVLDFFKLLETSPNYPEITNDDIEKTLMSANIKIWSDVPAFQYQGMNYHMTMFDAAIYPETRPPKRWNKYHGENQFLDKHTGSIINNIKFWIPMMRQMTLKFLKKNTNK